MSATKERWLPVIGYEGFYEVSDQGRVRSLDREITFQKGGGHHVRKGRILASRVRNGYILVDLSRDGVQSTRYVHRLVLEAFKGECPPGHEACHWNGDPADNRLENLRWGTSSENNLDQVRHGTHPNAVKTECPQGHEYTPENTMILPEGSRACRTCRRDRQREYKARIAKLGK